MYGTTWGVSRAAQVKQNEKMNYADNEMIYQRNQIAALLTLSILSNRSLSRLFNYIIFLPFV